ncbi:hypothetical protein B8W72_17425 [Pseudomonas putida]|uniref:Uncharacterized protein n=1 Tax=Pseudomonas putida TaxID=303 RepID=A0A1Y3KZL0_PSEPU|nr:hypothetical protein B8W72_17425 [Pseudomonas putida]
MPVPASSRVNPLPQERRCSRACGAPVGAGLPAKGPEQVTWLCQPNCFCSCCCLATSSDAAI